MKAKTIGYWAVTAIVALAFIGGGAMDLMQGPELQAGMAHLGYPAYFATILGAWKIGGGVAVLAPKFPRLKEWAYAGFAFTLVSALIAPLAVGDGPEAWGFAVATGVLWGLSYFFWRRLE